MLHRSEPPDDERARRARRCMAGNSPAVAR